MQRALPSVEPFADGSSILDLFFLQAHLTLDGVAMYFNFNGEGKHFCQEQNMNTSIGTGICDALLTQI